MAEVFQELCPSNEACHQTVTEQLNGDSALKRVFVCVCFVFKIGMEIKGLALWVVLDGGDVALV